MSLDSLEGDLQQIRLPRILFLLGAQEGNGILTVQGEDDIVAVSFVQGSIVTADALNQTVEDGLGKVLQGKGWLAPDAFQAAAREHQGGAAGSLGELLVGKGMISRQQLLEALRLQTLRSMFQLLTWKSGEAKFYSGDEVSFEQGFVPIGVDELLLRALNKLGEKAGMSGSIPDEQAVYRQVPPRGPVKILGRDGTGMDPGVWVSKLQADFLAKLTGQISTSDLSRSMGLSRQQVLFTLYHLIQNDLIEDSGQKAGGAPGAGRQATDPSGIGGRSGMMEAPSGLSLRPEPSSTSIPSPMAQASGTAIPSPMAQASGTAIPRPMGQPSGTSIPRPDGSGVISRPGSEILAPPEPGTGAVPLPIGGDDPILNWSGVGLAAILLIGVLLSVMMRPVALLLPFPWQENTRSTVEHQVRESLFRRIDHSARTYFLMEAHYPDSLQEIRDLSLISGADTKDPAGYELQYSTEVVTYSIGLLDQGQEIEGLGTTEAITGDFLVDPQFLGTAATAEDPVVLLD